MSRPILQATCIRNDAEQTGIPIQANGVRTAPVRFGICIRRPRVQSMVVRRVLLLVNQRRFTSRCNFLVIRRSLTARPLPVCHFQRAIVLSLSHSPSSLYLSSFLSSSTESKLYGDSLSGLIYPPYFFFLFLALRGSSAVVQ